jgi:hypothetical protein
MYTLSLLCNEEGQDIAEYAVMLGVILVLWLERFGWLARTRITSSLRSRVPSTNEA